MGMLSWNNKGFTLSHCFVYFSMLNDVGIGHKLLWFFKIEGLKGWFPSHNLAIHRFAVKSKVTGGLICNHVGYHIAGPFPRAIWHYLQVDGNSCQHLSTKHFFEVWYLTVGLSFDVYHWKFPLLNFTFLVWKRYPPNRILGYLCVSDTLWEVNWLNVLSGPSSQLGRTSKPIPKIVKICRDHSHYDLLISPVKYEWAIFQLTSRIINHDSCCKIPPFFGE